MVLPLMRNTLNCLLAAAVFLGSAAMAGDVSRTLLDIGERLYLEPDGTGIFADATVYEPTLVGAFYEARNYEPAWTDPEYVGEIVALLESSQEEGLNPDDYHLSQLFALKQQYAQPWSDQDYLRAKAEVLLTDGVVLYAKHLIQGKVDPRSLDSSWNYDRREFDPALVAGSLSRAIEQRQVVQLLEELKVDMPFYALMKSELKRFKELAQGEEFEALPVDKVLHPGDSEPEIPLLRRRLRELAYLPADSVDSVIYDAELEEAVRQMQRDNGLDADGVVGKQSYALLNMSYSDKVGKLRLNLDRLRWISQDISNEFIVVNIAGFELYYMRDLETHWETPVMVGKTSTRTPIFKAPLRYLEFNPTWNAPRSLVMRSVYPKVRENPRYAIEKGYKFYNAAGDEVDPMSIDFSSSEGRDFPYRVVQMPGPANAMGQVKFMFPNHHAVYLHDTPSRALFSRSQRAFSAGCIRVKNPLELAENLLDDPQNWSARDIAQVIDSAEPQKIVRFERPIDVMLMYWTVSPAGGGRLSFHHDIYNLDSAALEVLNASPVPTTSG